MQLRIIDREGTMFRDFTILHRHDGPSKLSLNKIEIFPWVCRCNVTRENFVLYFHASENEDIRKMVRTIDCSDKIHEGLIRIAAPSTTTALIECMSCDRELDEIYMYDTLTAEVVCTECGLDRQKVRDMKKEKKKKIQEERSHGVVEPTLRPGPRGRPKKKKEDNKI